MKYKIILNPDKQIMHDDLTQAISCFYQKSTEWTNDFIEFYEDNRLLFTWVRGKGIIEKVRKAVARSPVWP